MKIVISKLVQDEIISDKASGMTMADISDKYSIPFYHLKKMFQTFPEFRTYSDKVADFMSFCNVASEPVSHDTIKTAITTQSKINRSNKTYKDYLMSELERGKISKARYDEILLLNKLNKLSPLVTYVIAKSSNFIV